MPPPKPPSLLLLRTFSTTPTLPLSQRIKLKNRAAADAQRFAPKPTIPPYPYGASQFYKQSNKGLYGSSRIRFGNTVSTKNEVKNRRIWRPSIHSKRLWSDALERFVRVRVQARVLRTIDKVGGLDEYLLGERAGRIKELGVGGWALRWRLLGTEKVRERYKAERRRLGLPEEGIFYQGREGGVVGEEEYGEEVKAFDEELDEEEKRAEKEGEEAAGVVVGDGETGDLVRERPREVLDAGTADDEDVSERGRDNVDTGFMEEQEKPKEESKGLLGRLWRR